MHYLEALWDLFHTHIHEFLTFPHTLQCSRRERSWELRRLHFAVCCALFILMYTRDWCCDSMSVKPLWGLKSFPDKVAVHGPTCPVTGKCPLSYIKTVSSKPASACLSLPGVETVCVGGVLFICLCHLYLNLLCAVMHLWYGRLHEPENQNCISFLYKAPGTPYMHPCTAMPNLFFWSI